MIELKQKLYDLCKAHLATQIESIEAAIADRRDAMHNETKSSMGDKYETTREMLQQDINMNMQRLSKAKADEAVLNSIDATTTSGTVVRGSVVMTNASNYFIAISAGQLVVDAEKYYTVSPDAPISLQLLGKQKSDTITINGKSIAILKVL